MPIRVIERTHHAPEVDAIVLTLAGAVLWAKDPSIPLVVRGYDGGPANVLWPWICGRRYALAYARRRGCIELRDRTTRGRPFTASPIAHLLPRVLHVFSALKTVKG